MNRDLVYLVTLKPSSHRTAEEALGIQYLASILSKNNYQVKIMDSWLNDNITVDDIYNDIKKNKDRVLFVGTSSYMLNNKPTCELIKKLKEDNINVASGGYGPTFEPEIFLNSGSKFAMFGEGEKTIVDIAKFFENKLPIESMKGVFYYDNNQKLVKTNANSIMLNLDELPYPQRPYLDIVKKRHSTINVLTSRGCMGCCNFCSISAFLGEQKNVKWRGRTINNIIPELIDLKKKGATTIKFVDDSFIEKERDENWCKELCKQIKDNNIKIQFRASIRADKVTDNTIKYLKEAGFFSFSCGIENGSKTALKRMGKLASIDDNIRALSIFEKYGIYVQGGFILFDNKTTLQELKENYEFLNKYKWLVSKGIFSEMYAAVGTKFTKDTKLENNDKFMSNSIYLVEDNLARIVYDYMKKWQANHAFVYDMVIDPISAPKDVPVSSMKKYYDLMIEMKEIDLLFMKNLLDYVEKRKNVEELYNNFFKKYEKEFSKIKGIAERYYKIDNLNYDGSVNKFLFSTAKIDKVDNKNLSFEQYLKNNEFLCFLFSNVKEEAKKHNSEEFFLKHFVPSAKICYNLAKKLNVDIQDAIIVGLFHDYGKFLINTFDNHEIIGAQKVQEILKTFDYDKTRIDNIVTAISDHRKNANSNLPILSKIIIDADSISYIQNLDYFSKFEKTKNPNSYNNIINDKVKKSIQRLDEVGKAYLSNLNKNRCLQDKNLIK